MSTLLAGLLLTAFAGAAAAEAPARETRAYRLYKFQQPIGLEETIQVPLADGSTELRTSFAFTDRRTTVPLASTLTVAADGSARRLQIWGSTSRWSRADALVELRDDRIAIDRSGEKESLTAPVRFFFVEGYAPVAVTESLWRYWDATGRPASIPIYPSGGTVEISRRGTDSVTDDEGHTQSLERFTIAGLAWGRETIWIDSAGRLVALKAVDAEFDHFEATARGYSDALPGLIASSARDGLVQLGELARDSMRTTRGAAPEEGAEAAVAWIGATVVDGTGAPPIRDAVIVVRNGRLEAVGARGRVKIPRGARQVDVRGKTIVPGLWDMHAHFAQVEWGPLYLAAGITTARDCANELDFITAARDAIAAGEGLGPRLLLACIVDGEGPGSIGIDRLRDASGIAALVERFRSRGCAQVKIYSSFDPKLIPPLAAAAHAAGMTVTGHVPSGIGAVAAVEAGYDQINHLSSVVRAFLAPDTDPAVQLSAADFRKAIDALDLDSPAARKTLAFLAERKVVVDPTMALGELGAKSRDELLAVEPGFAKLALPLRPVFASFGVPPDRIDRATAVWRTSQRVLTALHRAGVPIVAGTDQAVPGHSLYRELELYVEAGFSPMEALQAATIVPARAMRRDTELGTLERGKIADFAVVDADPLADIRNLREISTVVTGGRAHDTAALWRLVGFEP